MIRVLAILCFSIQFIAWLHDSKALSRCCRPVAVFVRLCTRLKTTCFRRRDIPDGLQQSMVVEPVYPVQRGQFDGFPGFPGAASMNQLRFVQPVDSLGQGVVVAVATASNRRFDAHLSQALRVADGHILRASVGVVDQCIGVHGLTGIERLLQGQISCECWYGSIVSLCTMAHGRAQRRVPVENGHAGPGRLSAQFSRHLVLGVMIRRL